MTADYHMLRASMKHTAFIHKEQMKAFVLQKSVESVNGKHFSFYSIPGNRAVIF